MLLAEHDGDQHVSDQRIRRRPHARGIKLGGRTPAEFTFLMAPIIQERYLR
jgi:hypothetical protein